MDDRVSRLHGKVGVLLDLLQHADRGLFVEATELLLVCWEEMHEDDDPRVQQAAACVDLATSVLHDSQAALEHLRAAISHLRGGT